MTVLERFTTKVEKSDGCWEWRGARAGNGYGMFWLDGKLHAAHRVSYELAKGPIPSGLPLDHLCRNRGCVRPDHLEAVTVQVNTLRGEGISAMRAKQTHCHRGHPLSGLNLRIDHKGNRACRTCDLEQQRIRRGIAPSAFRDSRRVSA